MRKTKFFLIFILFVSLVLMSSQAAASFPVQIVMGSGDAEGKAKAFIVILPEQAEVYSLDIVIGYDASGISPVAVNKLTSIADWLLSTNLNTPGTIRLGLAGATPLAATAAVIEIEFSVSKPVENDSLQPLSAALNEVSSTSNFLYDQAAPVLTIATPADNGKTKDPAVAVAGTVDEIATVEVSLNNGALQPVMMTGKSFSLPLTLASGANTFDISATDLVGNRGTVSRTVTYDALPPALAITNPSQDTTTNQNNITIQGTATDLSAVTLTLTDGTNPTSWFLGLAGRF